MKLTPEESRIVERMGSGVLSRAGMLGTDGRQLPEILDTDRATVEALGVTHERIAARLDAIYRQAELAQGAPVEVAEGLQASHVDARGRIPCPWPGCGGFEKGEVALTDARTGWQAFLTPLSIHMIAAHGFYQGRGARYRLEPGELVRRLALTPEA